MKRVVPVVDKIRNPNIEIRNKFEFSKFKTSKPLCLEHLKFGPLRLFRISPACAKPRHAGRRQGFRASNLDLLEENDSGTILPTIPFAVDS